MWKGKDEDDCLSTPVALFLEVMYKYEMPASNANNLVVLYSLAVGTFDKG